MWFNIPPHLFVVCTLPLRPWKSPDQQYRSIFFWE